MLNLAVPLPALGWALIPGPLEMEGSRTSVDLQEITEYAPEDIAQTLLRFPGMEIQHPAEPSWWEWKARWQGDGRFIDIDMTLLEGEQEWWGGSGLQGNGTIGDVLALWSFLRASHPAIWLHNDYCEMHTPDSFAEEYTA